MAALFADISSIRQSIGYIRLDDKWIDGLNGYQYKVTPDEQSWHVSRAICKSWGGDLMVHGVEKPYFRT